MATRAELIFSVKELLKEHTDDSLIADEHVLFQIKAYRAMLLRQLYSDRSKAFDDAAKQTFCADMILTDPGICGIDTGCFILRSEEKIPGLLSVKGRSALTRVGPPIIGLPGYELVTPEAIKACMDDPYSGSTAFIMDNYLYLVGRGVSTKLIKCVSVTGIFEDPEKLEALSSCDACNTPKHDPCFSDEADLPMPSHLIAPIINMTVKEFVGVKKLDDHRDTDNNSVPE